MTKLRNWARDLCWYLGVGLSRLFGLDVAQFFHVEATSIHNCPMVLDKEVALELILECKYGVILGKPHGDLVTSHATHTTTWYEDEKPTHIEDCDCPYVSVKFYVPIKCHKAMLSFNIGKITDTEPLRKDIGYSDLHGFRIYHLCIPFEGIYAQLSTRSAP